LGWWCYHGTNSSCTNSDIDPVISEHTNVELLHHIWISTTYDSSVGIEAKWMKIPPPKKKKNIKWRRSIKHKLRTLIASLQRKLNKAKKKTTLNLTSSCYVYTTIPICWLNRFKVVNEWMLFNFKRRLVQLYRGKPTFIYTQTYCLWDGAVHFVLDQQSWILIVINH
jgi:hypothetical protein